MCCCPADYVTFVLRSCVEALEGAAVVKKEHSLLFQMTWVRFHRAVYSCLLTPLPGDPVSSFGLSRYYTHMVHRHAFRQTLIHIKISKTSKSVLKN